MYRGFAPIILLVAAFLLATIADGVYYLNKTVNKSTSFQFID